MKKTFIVASTLLVLFGLIGCNNDEGQSQNQVTIKNLRNNLVSENHNVDKTNVTFSWEIESSINDDIQTAYNIKIYQSKNDLEQNISIYNTDWVNESSNTNVVIDSLNNYLDYNHIYYWTVSIKNSNNKIYNSSKASYFKTDYKEVKNVRGFWGSDNDGKAEDDFCFFRCDFDAKDLLNIDKAFLFMTGLSPEPTRQFVYQAYVNGSFVGLGPSRLGKDSNNNNVLYWNEYEIADLLKERNNAVGIIAYTTEYKAIYLSLSLYYKDGTVLKVIDSSSGINSFKSLLGDEIFRKDNSIGTGYYVASANNIDATRYPFDFSSPTYDANSWNECSLIDYMDKDCILKPYCGANVNLQYTKNISPKNDSDFLQFDLTKEIIGGVCISFNTPIECEVEMRYGEQLENGRVKYNMITSNMYKETWKLKKGEQTISNISMMAYRYVEILNLPEGSTVNSLKGIEYHTAWDDSSSFFSSNNVLLNQLYEQASYTSKATTQDLFVDSYSRERAPYEGDAYINQILLKYTQSNYYTSRFTIEWLLGRPTWPAEYKLLFPKMVLDDYYNTGDLSFITQYYELIKTKNYDAYFDNVVHLIKIEETPFERYLIDWPENERDGYDESVDYNTVFNCLHHKTYLELTEIAHLLNRKEDVAYYQNRAELLKESIIGKLYNEEKGAFSDGLRLDGTKSQHCSQHATAYALYSDVFTNKEMTEQMVKHIGTEIKMSVYGSFFLLEGLINSGYNDIAYKLLTKPSNNKESRTFDYIVNGLDATICPEAWGESYKDNMTFSHPWSSAPINAIVKGIFGIKPTSGGYSTFDVVLCPCNLETASITIPTIKGSIYVSFNTDKKTVKVNIPANTKARLFVPDWFGDEAYVNNQPFRSQLIDEYYLFNIGCSEKVISFN